jgi:hypothetical protein
MIHAMVAPFMAHRSVLRNVVAVCMMSGKIQKIHRKKRRQRMK